MTAAEQWEAFRAAREELGQQILAALVPPLRSALSASWRALRWTGKMIIDGHRPY